MFESEFPSQRTKKRRGSDLTQVPRKLHKNYEKGKTALNKRTEKSNNESRSLLAVCEWCRRQATIEMCREISEITRESVWLTDVAESTREDGLARYSNFDKSWCSCNETEIEPCLHQLVTQLSSPVIGWRRLWNENIICLRDDAGYEGQVTDGCTYNIN